MSRAVVALASRRSGRAGRQRKGQRYGFDGFDPEEALGAIEAPVHLLAGTVGFGGTIESRDVERLATLVHRYTHRIMPDVGHFIHHTTPSDFVDEVRTFASKCG